MLTVRELLWDSGIASRGRLDLKSRGRPPALPRPGFYAKILIRFLVHPPEGVEIIIGSDDYVPGKSNGRYAFDGNTAGAFSAVFRRFEAAFARPIPVAVAVRLLRNIISYRQYYFNITIQ